MQNRNKHKDTLDCLCVGLRSLNYISVSFLFSVAQSHISFGVMVALTWTNHFKVSAFSYPDGHHACLCTPRLHRGALILHVAIAHQAVVLQNKCAKRAYFTNPCLFRILCRFKRRFFGGCTFRGGGRWLAFPVTHEMAPSQQTSFRKFRVKRWSLHTKHRFHCVSHCDLLWYKLPKIAS